MKEPKEEPAQQAQFTELIVGDDDLGKRLDLFVVEHQLGTSRSKIKEFISRGCVTVDGKPLKASTQLRPGQRVCLNQTAMVAVADEPEPGEDIALEILFEDEHLIAINKPSGMVVHPAKGHWSGTLTAALSFHFNKLSGAAGPERPGIVHRLDRDTSGVILVAKDDLTHLRLTEQFEQRSVNKQYLAVVSPPPQRDRDIIDAPIAPHPYQREKMAIRPDHPKSRPAQTFYEVKERHGRLAILHAFPKTGRTHQIRVHLAHVGSPVVADRQYSGRAMVSREWIVGGESDGAPLIQRQALHAESIDFLHPQTQQPMSLSAPIPADLRALIECLRMSAGGSARPST